MKWFKHLSDASENEFIEKIEELFGLEGYARWFKLLEKIAIKMDESGDCFAEHSWIKWQSFLKGKRNKLELFLGHCQNEDKIFLEQNGNILRIICPKLLELRDEHTKKSGVRWERDQELLRTKSKDIDIDKDKDIKLKNRERELRPREEEFKNLKIEKEFMEFAITEKYPIAQTERCFKMFKIHYEEKPLPKWYEVDSHKLWLSTWKKWLLRERPEKQLLSASQTQALSKEESLIHKIGITQWRKDTGFSVNSKDAKELEKWILEKGAVTWWNLPQWREQQQKLNSATN